MRTLSLKTWGVTILALASAAIVGLGTARMVKKPPIPTALGGRAMGERRLIVGGADVLVLEDKRAFRVDASLHVRQLVFPELTIDEVQSMAQADGKVVVTVKAHDHDPDTTWPAVLLVDDEKVTRLWKPGSDVKHAHLSNVRVAEAEEGEPKDTRFAVYIQEDDRVYRLPIVGVGRDADEDRHRLDAWFRAVTVEKIVWREGEGPLFLCATERRHLDEKLAPVMPTVAIDLFGHDHESPEVKKLPLVLPEAAPPKIELSAIASRASGFVAAPLGNNWLWLGDRQALVTDAGGARLDRVSRLSSFLDDASPIWLGLLGIFGVSLLLLPLFAVRAFGAGELARSRALTGTLKVPGGAALDTDKRGHVEVTPGACVRVDGQDLELGPGLMRADSRFEVPLIDGDAVFVLGRAEGDDAGAYRSSGKKRLLPDGNKYAIGRGGANDLATEVTARADRRVLRVALAVVVIGIVLLLRFGSVAFQ